MSAGNKSKIPPRTAKSPLRSTRSDLIKPNSLNLLIKSLIINWFPTLIFICDFSKLLGMIG